MRHRKQMKNLTKYHKWIFGTLVRTLLGGLSGIPRLRNRVSFCSCVTGGQEAGEEPAPFYATMVFRGATSVFTTTKKSAAEIL